MSAATAQAVRAQIAETKGDWDYVLMVTVAALLGLGLVMVHSASIPAAAEAGEPMRFLLRQGLHVALGLGVLWAVARTPIDWWQYAGPVLVLFGMIMLVLVLVPGVGTQINGSSRWFQLGPVNLQPSEFVKVFMLIYAAGFLTRRSDRLTYFTKGILMIGIVVGLIAMLLLMEPDFGSAVVITVTVFGMLFLAGVRFWHFLSCLLAGMAGMTLLTLLAPYRMQRITAFLNPWSDPFDSGFQLTQSLIAFGRGEWFGVGLGASIQKLHYLPAANTDFLFAVIGEELGLFGVLAVIGLFAFLVWQAMVISRRAELIGQVFAARLAQGVGLLIGGQAMINMGVNMGALPTKGLTLPLMSYGGSSMLASCMAIGLLFAVVRVTKPVPGARR